MRAWYGWRLSKSATIGGSGIGCYQNYRMVPPKEGGDADYEAAELPQDMRREITSWLAGLLRLAAGISPVMQSHGYSGRWRIDNRFDRWRGLPVEHPDSIYFHGLAVLAIPPDGQGGTGIMYGATYISVQGYNARLDVVNEIRDATVSQDGGLRLRIEVIRRHLADEGGSLLKGDSATACRAATSR